MIKIAISGSAGTGKTTLALALASKFRCMTIAESYDDFFDDDCEFIKPASRLRHQIVETLELKHRAEIARSDFIADRCPADLFNLWLSRGFASYEKETADFYNRCRSYMQKYNRIIVLPWSELLLQQVKIHGSRRQRVMNSWIQLHNHSTMIGLLQQWVAPNRLLPVPFDVVETNARIEFVKTAISES